MPDRRVILAIWVVGLLVGGGIIGRTSISTDMSAFLPRSPTPEQQILVEQLREGVVSRLVLLAIEGAPVETLAAMSRALANSLRTDPSFVTVNNGDEAAFARDRDVLWGNRYLLSPAVVPDHFSPGALHEALEADVRLLGSDMGVLAKRSIPADPTGEMLRLISAFVAQARPAMRDGVWVSGDGRRALLMAQTAAPGFDIDAQERALSAIEAAFAAAQRSGPDGAAQARLIETGPPVFAVRTRTQMKADVQRFSLIATILVSLILLYAYRSVRILVLALLPVLSGVIAGIAAVSVGFGFVHGITLGFGVTLIGEAVDYAIYLFTQTAPGTSPTATIIRIWPILRLGMLTSVCGFGAMLLSSFVGFAQLGLFTITGLVVALAVTRWVLPILLPGNFTAAGSTVFAIPVLALIRRRSMFRLVVLGLAVAAGVSVACHTGPYWDDELASMSPVPLAAKTLDEQLRREIGAPDVRYVLVAPAPSREEALLASEHAAARIAPLVAAGALAGFDAPSRWLPSLATQRARQDALPDAAALEASLKQALEGMPFRADTFRPFLADVDAARHQRLLQRGDLNGTSLALRVDSLLVQNDGRWLAMLPLREVSDVQTVKAAIAANDGMFLDLKMESDRLLGTYLHEAVTLSVAGAGVISLLLAVSLRSLRRIATVLVPLAVAVLCTAALLLMAGGRLSIFNLFGLLLVVAVGSNYCLFFAGRSLNEADPSAGRLAASLLLANACTVIGFGILSFSAIPVLHGIGVTVAIGTFLSLLCGAILSGRPTPPPLDFGPRDP